MIEEYERVKIKKTGEFGLVIDVREKNGKFYLVELDKDNEVIDCTEDELEKL